MSFPSTYVWPVLDNTAICASQAIVVSTTNNLILNGTLGHAPIYPTIFLGTISRTISITSTHNLSTCSATITGTYNGSVQVDAITCPNATTVYTDKLFDSVSSVVVNSPLISTIEIGTGTTGHTNWFAHNRLCAYPSLMVQVYATAAAITYSFDTTVSDVKAAQYIADPSLIDVMSGIIKPVPGSTSPFVEVLSASTGDDFGCYQYPSRYSRIRITSSNAAGKLTATLMQQAG